MLHKEMADFSTVFCLWKKAPTLQEAFTLKHSFLPKLSGTFHTAQIFLSHLTSIVKVCFSKYFK